MTKPRRYRPAVGETCRAAGVLDYIITVTTRRPGGVMADYTNIAYYDFSYPGVTRHRKSNGWFPYARYTFAPL